MKDIKENSNNFNLDNFKQNCECDGEQREQGLLSKYNIHLYTIVLCYANLTYGISFTCMSPALLDYTCILEQDAELVSHFYTAYAIGNIMGSSLGVLFKHVNRQLTLVFALFFYGLTTLLLPINPNLIVFYFFGLVAGIGAGCLDIVQTAWLIEMWQHRSGSILQLSEFSYGIGIIIGPLLVRPFLFDDCDGFFPNGDPGQNITLPNQTLWGHKLYFPFFTSGCLQILAAVMMVTMYFIHRYVPKGDDNQEIDGDVTPHLFYQRRYTIQIIDSKHLNQDLKRMGKLIGQNEKGFMKRRYSTMSIGRLPSFYKHTPVNDLVQKNSSQEKKELSSKLPKTVIMCLGAVCFATMIAAENAFIDFSPTFFKFYYRVEPPTTAVLLSVMTGSYTLTRLVSIFVALKVRPEVMLTVHYGLTSLAIIVLFIAYNNATIVWLGNVLFGIGIATFWSATFAHIEQYLDVTDRICTVYVSALGVIGCATQFIEGPFLEKKPEVLLFYCFSALITSFVCFVAIRLLVFRFNRQRTLQRAKA